MKKFKTLILCILSLAMCLGFTGCDNSGIVFEKDTLTMELTDTATLNILNYSVSDVLWFTSNSEVVTVNADGLVTAKSIGKASVKAIVGTQIVSCAITVVNGTRFAISEPSVALEEKQSEYKLSVTTNSIDDVVWVSDNLAVAKVDDNGYVTAQKAGSAVITAECGPLSAMCNVVVTEYGVGFVSIATKQEFLDVFAGNSAEALNGRYFLTADIDFGGASIPTIGGWDGPAFNGTFDGLGHALKNFKVTAEAGSALFASLGAKAIVRQTGFINVNSTSTNGFPAIIAGKNEGVIENCYIQGGSAVNSNAAGWWCHGGIVCSINAANGTIKNIIVNSDAANAINYTNELVYPLIGWNMGNAKNCFFIYSGTKPANLADPLTSTRPEAEGYKALVDCEAKVIADLKLASAYNLSWSKDYWEIADGSIAKLIKY